MLDTLLRTVFADERQRLRDLAVRTSGGQQRQHLALARGELGEDHLVLRGQRAGQVAEHPLRDRRTEDRLAIGHRRDRTYDVRTVGALDQVAARTRPHRREHRLVVLEHRQHQHAGRRVRRRRSVGWPRRRSSPACSGPSPRPRVATARRGARPPRRRRPRPPPPCRRPRRAARAARDGTRGGRRPARRGSRATHRESCRHAGCRRARAGTPGRLPPSSVARSRIAVRPTPPEPCLRPQPHAVVLDLDAQPGRVVHGEHDPAGPRRGVPSHVGERLRRDPVGRHLDRRREAAAGRRLRPRPRGPDRAR